MEYLDDILGTVSPLRPNDPLKVARMRAMMRYIDEVPTPAVRVPSYNLAFLPHYQAMTEEEFLAVCESKPLRREFLLKMGRTGFPKSEMDEALGRIRRSMERMTRWLRESGGPWLMGEDLTLADIAIMPVIVRMDDINLGHLLGRDARNQRLARPYPRHRPVPQDLLPRCAADGKISASAGSERPDPPEARAMTREASCRT